MFLKILWFLNIEMFYLHKKILKKIEFKTY